MQRTQLSQYRWYFLFRTIRVEYSFVTSLMMLRKEETVGTYATGGIAYLRSKWTALEMVKWMYSRQKSKSTVKTWINARSRKIMIRFFTKLVKIMCNTWNRFWKKLGNCPGPEHFRSPCAAVPSHFLTRGRCSFVLQYVKPWVRNYIMFTCLTI